MATTTALEWADTTWNPTTGCDRISRGCENCYAIPLAKRLKAMGMAKYQRDGDPRTSGPGFAVTVHPTTLSDPLRWRGRRRVLVNSMSDLFHARVPVSFVRDVFEVIAATPPHTYLVLTKRSSRLKHLADRLDWPDNLWLGVAVEDSGALGRVEDLRRCPARHRFLCCEPLLGSLDDLDLDGIGWVIAGGESGSGSRAMDPEWVRGVRDACTRADVAFFCHQWGGRSARTGGPMLDGRTWDEFPEPSARPLHG